MLHSWLAQRFLFIVLGLSISGVNLPLALADVEFQNATPLSQAVKTPVEDCSSTSPISLPLITWGGDIATIYANGNQAETGSGSIFDKLGLKFKLFREDVFANQLKSYLSCKSPYLRGTLSMIHLAGEVANQDPRTRMTVVYQLTWSAGGDAMVVKGNIQSPNQLKGKTIAVQTYGPHIDYLGKILKDAGLSMKDVKIRWTKDLTGTNQTPMTAIYKSDIDAAMVIIPDALKLTSNGTVGTGAEDSVKGARILLSTKTANRIISDVYAVRSDFFAANRNDVMKFVQGLLIAQEDLASLVRAKVQRKTDYENTMKASARLLMDSEQAMADTAGMYGDASFAGWTGNMKFFADPKNPRSFEHLGQEIQETLTGAGLLTKAAKVKAAGWDYNVLKKDLKNVSHTEASHFNADKVAQVAAKRSAQNKPEGELFRFEVLFKPNQNSFRAADYADAFKKAVSLAATYGGAVITVEGHSDPLGYLKKKKESESPIVLSRIRQSAKNLSLTRAGAVRDNLLQYAKSLGIAVDPGQFAVVGQGIEHPKTGICGEDPCAPQSEKDWLSNMRVEFRIIQVEAEENVFQSL